MEEKGNFVVIGIKFIWQDDDVVTDGYVRMWATKARSWTQSYEELNLSNVGVNERRTEM